MKQIAFLLTLGLIFISCSESPTSIIGDFIISDADEVQLGKNYYSEIKTSAEYPLAASTEPLAVYINEIGQKVLAASMNDAGFRKPDASIGFGYTFSVINDDVVNAFATPGGYIYIYKGLIDKAKNEAEVATVISHEMGHVVKKHFKSQYVQTYGTQQILEMIAGEGLISNAVTYFASNKYSRVDEFEADSCGVVYSAKAGYNAYAFVGFFETLKTISGSGDTGILEYFSSHPDTDDRIAAVRSQLKRKYPSIVESDSASYFQANFLLKTGR